MSNARRGYLAPAPAHFGCLTAPRVARMQSHQQNPTMFSSKLNVFEARSLLNPMRSLRRCAKSNRFLPKLVYNARQRDMNVMGKCFGCFSG